MSSAIRGYLLDLGVDRPGEPNRPPTEVRVIEARVGKPGSWLLTLYSWKSSAGAFSYWEVRVTDIGGDPKVIAGGQERDVMVVTWRTILSELLTRAEVTRFKGPTD